MTNRGYPTLKALEASIDSAGNYLGQYAEGWTQDADHPIQMALTFIEEAQAELETMKLAADALASILLTLTHDDPECFTQSSEYSAALDIARELAVGPEADSADAPSFLDALSWADKPDAE